MWNVYDVSDDARADQVDVMLRDAYMMKGVSHDNVSCVIMTCLDHPPLLIYADLAGAAANLKTFLQRSKCSEVRLFLVHSSYFTKHRLVHAILLRVYP